MELWLAHWCHSPTFLQHGKEFLYQRTDNDPVGTVTLRLEWHSTTGLPNMFTPASLNLVISLPLLMSL